MWPDFNVIERCIGYGKVARGNQVAARRSAVDDVEHATMSNQKQGSPHVRCRKALYRCMNSLGKSAQRFAAAEVFVRITLTKKFCLGCIMYPHFFVGHALHASVVTLTQPRLGLYLEPFTASDRGGSLQCALQIAAVQRGKSLSCNAKSRNAACCRLRLLVAGGIKFNVKMPLDTTLHVPVGFAMANNA